MSRPNDAGSSQTERSPELLLAQQAADRINQRIKLWDTIEFRSDFVELTFRVERAYVGEYSLFMDAGSFGEIAVAPEHYHCFSGVDLRDLRKGDPHGHSN